MREALARCGVQLDRKVLADLALTEPRTFRAVTAVAAHITMQPEAEGGLGGPRCGPGIAVNSGDRL